MLGSATPVTLPIYQENLRQLSFFNWRKVAHLRLEIIPKQSTDAGARQLGVHGDNLIALANNYLPDGNF